MRLLLVSDTFPPSTISGALQMRDLAAALAGSGHRPVVLVPDSGLGQPFVLEEFEGIDVCRVRSPRTKDVAYVRRVAAEFVLPWVLRRGFRSSSLAAEPWDGIVWYSPTIFLGPLVAWFKRHYRCPSYLILRDLFPDWAVDAGVMRRDGVIHRALKRVERYQYRQADVIGVQTPANVSIVAADAPAEAVLEVLHNWLNVPPVDPSEGKHPILASFGARKVFVYAGNVGLAQDLDAFVELASRLGSRTDVGFLLIGRGSEQARLRKEIDERGLDNIRIEAQVPQSDLSAILSHCYAGIIALHPSHGTHNIPGKLLTYLYSGLPVLARVNPGNDLHRLVLDEEIGESVMGSSLECLAEAALRLADQPERCVVMGRNGKALAARLFSPAAAAAQVVRSLSAADPAAQTQP